MACPVQSPCRVLVTDDDALVCSLVVAILSEDGYLVAQAATVQDCADAIRNFDPGLVLLDIHLIDGHGVDLVHRVCAAARGRPVILAFSGRCLPDEVNLLGNGALDGFLAKPLRRDALRAAVAEAVHRVRAA